jgi:hypothetical protein
VCAWCPRLVAGNSCLKLSLDIRPEGWSAHHCAPCFLTVEIDGSLARARIGSEMVPMRLCAMLRDAAHLVCLIF